jgi:23S rRNA pseudouridine1911/1915/1917 synthase
MTEPEIIYEDDHLIVCQKPAGIATQTKRLGQPDMESLLRNYVAPKWRRSGKKGNPYIGVVHRLDQPVEGVMVFAKTPQAAASLSTQVQKRSFGKRYYALVKLPENAETFAYATGLPEQGSLNDNLIFLPRENISKIVPKDTKGSKKVSLDYCVMTIGDGCALLDITLHTGRHHQIRAQLAHLGTPILGDTKYGSPDPEEGRSQLCLCSYYISFLHPADKRELVYTVNPQNKKLCELLIPAYKTPVPTKVGQAREP